MAVGNGKLILFGEHAAVYGHPALGIRLPAVLDVKIRQRHLNHWILPELDARSSELLRNTLDSLAGVLAPRGSSGAELTLPSGGEILLSGDLPISVGFGSSAAFCTGLVREAVTKPLTQDELWSAAHKLESVFHGTPSGIDTGLSIFPQCSIMFPDPPRLPTRRNAALPRCWLVVGAVPRVRSTGELVAAIRKRRDADPAPLDDLMAELGSLALDAADLGSTGDARALGGFARRAQEILVSLDLGTDPLENALEVLREAGSLGEKLSGGGGGGAFYGVFHSEQAAHEACRSLDGWLANNHPLPTGPFAITVAVGGRK